VAVDNNGPEPGYRFWAPMVVRIAQDSLLLRARILCHGRIEDVQPDVAALLLKAFPSALSGDVGAALGLVPEAEYAPVGSIGPVDVAGERVEIPSRVYFGEPADAARLTECQKKVLACIYTRHHNGFVRQLWLERLLPAEDPWVVPFVVQLLGEYVIQIVDVLWAHRAELQSASYQRFVAENQQYIMLTRERMISYWDCYYRRLYPRLSEYVGTRVWVVLAGPQIGTGRRTTRCS
jgi:hypothetical protein